MRSTKIKWIKPFLKSIRYQFYLVASILGIFALLIWLTRTPFNLLGYATQLILFVFFILLLFQWVKYEKRIEKVQSLNLTKNHFFDDVLLVASLHTVFAFPMLQKMLVLFGITSKMLLLSVTIGVVISFALLYWIIYRITSKVYLNIVE